MHVLELSHEGDLAPSRFEVLYSYIFCPGKLSLLQLSRQFLLQWPILSVLALKS